VNTKRKRRPKGALGELIAAGRRLTPQWLYTFARLQTIYETRMLDVPERQRAGLAWETLAFAKGRLGASGTTSEMADDEAPPAWADVTKAHSALWTEILAPLKTDGTCEARWTGVLMLRPDGTVREHASTIGLDFLEGFLSQAIEQLRQLARQGRRLRFCEVCGNPFAAKRPEAKTCPGTACRTLLWRRHNRARFREKRRAAYQRSMVARTGNPNIKIGRRPERAAGRGKDNG
jgi:hypothetical protein